MGTETAVDPVRQALIREHAWLVQFVIGRITAVLPDSVNREDVVTWGIVGLIQALDGFEPDRGVEFDTSAVPVIRASVMRRLQSHDWDVLSVHRRCRRIERKLAHLEGQLGRSAGDEEMAAALRMSVAEYGELLSEASPIGLFPLRALLSGADLTVAEWPFPPSDELPQDAERPAQDPELRRMLAAGIDTLPRSERLVLALYHREQLTVREISQALGVTESRVRQIYTQAVLRLRSRLCREPETV